MGFFDKPGDAPSDPQPPEPPAEGEVLDESLAEPEDAPEDAVDEADAQPGDKLGLEPGDDGEITLPETVVSDPVEAAPVETPAPVAKLPDPKDQGDDRYQGDPDVRAAAIEHGEAVPSPQKITEVVDNGGIKMHPPDLMYDVNKARGTVI